MTDHHVDEEPVVTLLDGEVVSRAVFDLMRELRASGHTITIDDDGDVQVVPAVNENAWFTLDTCRSDVSVILDAWRDEETSEVIVGTPVRTVETIH